MTSSLCLSFSTYRSMKSCLTKTASLYQKSHAHRCLHCIGCRQTFSQSQTILDTSMEPSVNPCHLATNIRRLFQSPFRYPYRIVKPGKVSPMRDVPAHIEKPAYATSIGVYKKPSKPEVKSEQQIAGMRAACALARKILDHAGEQLKVGMTTDDIDKIIHELTIENNAYPSPLKYNGFCKSVCTSVNNVACHGIPDDQKLEDGDIINVDITVFLGGYHGDVSETFLIGSVNEGGRRLVETAKKCRDVGIEACHPGARFCDIGNAIHDTATSDGFDVVPVFCGHGIGEYFHGPPDIFHFTNEGDELMQPGMTFTIEPIITEGRTDVRILGDGWTAISVDKSRSAQFEHTVLITDTGVDILTQ